jgi:hypothetical protein
MEHYRNAAGLFIAVDAAGVDVKLQVFEQGVWERCQEQRVIE